MRKVLVCGAMLLLVVILACGGGLDGEQKEAVMTERSMTADSEMLEEMEVVKEVEAFGEGPALDDTYAQATPAPEAAMAAPVTEASGRGSLESSASLRTVQRKIISTAFLSLEVEEVEGAVTQVRLLAESLGGFVEQLSSFGGPGYQQANVTVRVPQDEFSTALERIEALGIVLSRDLGSEDVSEQFIDLEARLKSALREEESLLKLLERASQVSEILAIERELARVRSEIERIQGQLNFLERRVALATINVSLSPPDLNDGEPPSASLAVEVSDVTGTVSRVKGLVSSLNGVLDRVFLSQRGDREQAELSIRLFANDFKQALDFLEGQGEVRSMDIVEGTPPSDGDAQPPTKPEARVNLVLAGEKDSSNTGLIVSIAAPLGSIGLLIALGLLFFLVYRTGRRRGV